MKKMDYFLKAIQNGLYKRLDWIHSAFCLISEDMEAYKADPFYYRIIQRRDGIFFVDPDKDGELTKLIDTDASKAPFHQSEKISLPKGSLPNVTKDITTTIGNVLINAIVLVYPFEGKIEFMEGVVKPKNIEAILIKRLKDDPKDPADKNPNEIYISDYLKFTEAQMFAYDLGDVFVPAASRKTMTPAPGIKELRKKLVEERKDRLSDPAVLAEIDEALVKYDQEWLKDDDTAQGFLTHQKKEVRRKLFMTVGAQAGFGDGVTVDHIEKSLSEGVDVEHLPVWNSGARLGSFNRGHQTMMGGAQVKRLLRAALNANVQEKDCGTKIGLSFKVTEDNAQYMQGFYMIQNGQTVSITEENVKSLIGKTITLRSTMYCKAEHNDYCKYCAGDKLAAHPTAVSVAVSDVGSAFLSLFLKKMHVSGLATAKMEYKEVFS